MQDSPSSRGTDPVPLRKNQELMLFLFLTVFLAPILSVAIVGGYGFIVWISQMLGN